MTTQRGRGILINTCLAVALTACTEQAASAQVLTTNGGFEAGFAGWTRVDQTGSLGTFALQSGTTSPVTGTTVPAPSGGTQAAMTDAEAPGSHVLFQEFTVPSVQLASAQLQFSVFIGNRANAFFIPNPTHLNFATPALNQQARVDIMRAGTDPFSVAAADVLLNTFQTTVGSPLVTGYNTINVDVTAALNANLGATLRLRFAEVDNVFTFQMGVDDVSLTVVPIPEPASMILCGLGALVGFRRMRRRWA
jgi:hypothetical protein